MYKLINRLNKRKGFTLVECIVAVAVFAAMVLLVFAILTRARVEAENANKSEEDLTILIDNVVGDETYKKFKAETDPVTGNQINSMQLNIGGSATSGKTFDITYNVIDGYKNFVECPNTLAGGVPCGHFADNTDFMTMAKEDFASSGTPADYVCPSCGYTFAQTLVCEECGNTASHKTSGTGTGFTYLPATASFACNSCGSAAVKGVGIDEKVASGETMSVSGILPNAIAYGKVTPFTDKSEIISIENAGGACDGGSVNVSIDYVASSNQSIPGTYTLSVTTTASGLPAGISLSDPFTVYMKLPPHYVVSNYNTTMTAGTFNVPPATNGSASNDPVILEFNYTSPGTFTVKFQLVNYKSGFSYEYDYNTNTSGGRGLAEHWFGFNPTITNDPNAPERIQTSRVTNAVLNN